MLALSRKKGEALVIANNVEVTILEIKGDQVKLGITAPREVPVYRKEIYPIRLLPMFPECRLSRIFSDDVFHKHNIIMLTGRPQTALFS